MDYFRRGLGENKRKRKKMRACFGNTLRMPLLAKLGLFAENGCQLLLAGFRLGQKSNTLIHMGIYNILYNIYNNKRIQMKSRCITQAVVKLRTLSNKKAAEQ